MNKMILKIAIPSIISSIALPFVGIANTAIAGHTNDPTLSVGQLSIAVSALNFIYWNCGFLSLGTTGLTAQAYGAGNRGEITAMLCRAVGISLMLGLLVVLFRTPFARVAVDIMGGDELAFDYLKIHIWAIPAGVMFYGFNGWFIGMQNTAAPMLISTFTNALNIALGVYFAIYRGMGILGIAYSTIISQWLAIALYFVSLFALYSDRLVRISSTQLFDRVALRRLFSINRDIIIRVLAISSVYSFFTAASARMDSPMILAANALLMQLYSLFSYISDAIGEASGALTGRFVGAKDRSLLKRAIERCALYSASIAVIYVLIFSFLWREILSILVDDESNSVELIAMAGSYVGWIITIPLTTAFTFLMDGVLAGATSTKDMRNGVLLSTVGFFLIFFSLRPFIGNNALWLSFSMFMLLRTITQYILTNRFNKIYNAALAV